jgi:hypothetical protein
MQHLPLGAQLAKTVDGEESLTLVYHRLDGGAGDDAWGGARRGRSPDEGEQ